MIHVARTRLPDADLRVAVIPPGHDAWVIGDEACVAIDWTGVARYAKPA